MNEQIKAGAEIHSDKGYEIGTKEKYDEFVKQRNHIGYIENETDKGYTKLYAPEAGSIVTHAFILCKYCKEEIYPSMGPKYNAVCLDCFKIMSEKEPES